MMHPITKALWFIESHLDETLTLDGIAAISGVSPYHLLRAFAARTGMSVMRYVRARRLSEAVADMKRSRTRILRLRDVPRCAGSYRASRLCIAGCRREHPPRGPQ